jgi:hypothetical protein
MSVPLPEHEWAAGARTIQHDRCRSHTLPSGDPGALSDSLPRMRKVRPSGRAFRQRCPDDG